MELAKSALLVNVNISLEGLLGERRDKGASAMVCTTYAAAAKRAKTSKYLINRQHKSVKAVVAAAQRVRDTVYRYTFPWGESKLRLLPSKAYDEFNWKIEEAIGELRQTWRNYESIYDSLVAESKQHVTGLGGLFDESQYPPVEKISQLFSADIEYWPMPEGGHFVADIAADAANTARDAIVKANIARTKTAINDMIGRVEATVQTYVTKLTNYQPVADDDPTREVKGIFRDSLIENVREMGRLVQALNFTNDSGIENLSHQIARLARVTAQTLRDSSHDRQAMISEGNALLAKLDAFRKLDKDVDEIGRAIADYNFF